MEIHVKIDNKNPCNRVKANALFFAIIISLIIGLLCSSLIFIAYFHHLQVQQNIQKERLLRNAQSAMSLILSPQSNFPDTTYISDLYGQNEDSVFISKKSWGMFEIGHVKAFSKKDTVSRTFMIGTVPNQVWLSALYLIDQGRPVTLAGKALIKGSCYLPKAGPQRGAVDGKDFAFAKLIDGEIKESSNSLPALNEKFLKKFIKSCDYDFKGNSLSEKLLRNDSLVGDFEKPTLRIHVAGRVLDLGKVKVKGNVILSSDTLIEVSSWAILENVILLAPKIRFKDDFKGSVQAIATDSIIAGEGTYFKYPSAFVMLEIDSIDNRPLMQLNNKCVFEGVILQYVSFIDNSGANLQLKKGSEIQGNVYADGLTALEGKISGTLVCNKFRLSIPSGTYDNYIVDCEINRFQLSKHFLGSPLFSNSKRAIAKWLD